MASIEKVQNKRGVSYRVFIRRPGLRAITKTFSTKRLAQEYARRIEGDRETAIALGGESAALTQTMTLAGLIDDYMLQYTGKDRSIGSRLSWWKAGYGHLKLIEVDPGLIKKALRTLAQTDGQRAHGRGKKVKLKSRGQRKPSTINRYKATLGGVFKWGMAELDLPSNPCRGVPARTENNKRVRFLSEKERKALLTACRASEWNRLYLLVSMAITTGARKSELLRLTWADIDFKTRRAYVSTSKNGDPRVLPLTFEVIQTLMKHRGKADALLFPSDKKPEQPFDFTKPWKQAMQDAGIENYRFHDNRHSCASFLAANGATLLQIAEVLGHKSTVVTMRYSHLCVDHKQSLIDTVMGGLLGAEHA